MQIRTDLGNDFDGDRLAYFVKCSIEGFAVGCVPMAPVWKLPPLYKSGIRFAHEPEEGSGREEFALPAVTYGRGWGDCDDLVIYRIWELLVSGEPASCAVVYLDTAAHVRVRRKTGHRPDCQCSKCIEDPSIFCGAR